MSFNTLFNSLMMHQQALTHFYSATSSTRVALPAIKKSVGEQAYTQVADSHGALVDVGEPFAKGGEGCIYPVNQRPNLVVKIYHPERLRAGRGELQAKIEAAIELYSQRNVLHDLPLAWPLMSVFDSTGNWVGYVMRKARGQAINVFRSPPLMRKYFPNLDRLTLVRSLEKLVRNVQVLHQQGIFLGDINLDNFILDTDREEFWMIDCDSFQFSSQGKQYRCPVGQDSMLPPEHQGRQLKNVVRTAHSDTFSLTVLIFMLLMSGRHPFESIGKVASPAKNIRNGHFPYGKKGVRPGTEGAIPRGPWYTLWSHLPYALKSVFMTTFGEGLISSELRIPLTQVAAVLKDYAYGVAKTHHTNELWPKQAKQSKK
ncbi:hypothetical protein P0C22_15390 [Plesiomonas shigelloides]|uniref:hypothetical protein n=1 Tax=Plesiomonas shigelloides TaxID=703 RepID=UPI0030BE11DD